MRNNNQKAVKKLSVRILKKNKTRNLFAILAICLTSLLFTAIFSMGIGMGQILQEQTMREVGGRFHAGLKHVTLAQYENIIKDSRIKSATYNIFLGLAENIRQRQSELRIAENQEEMENSFVELKEGSFPRGYEDIVVDTLVLKELKIPAKLGEKVPIRFSFMGQEIVQEFTLCGWYEGDQISQASQVYLSMEYWDSLKADYTEADFLENYEQTGQPIGLVNGNLFLENSRDIEEKIKSIIEDAGYMPEGENQEREGQEKEIVDYGVNWAYMSSRTEGMDVGTMVLLGGAFLIILITGYLIIYNIFQLSVLKEIRFYGLLKTVGTTRRQLKKIVYRQAGRLSLLGIPLGILLGFILGQLLLPMLSAVTGYKGTSALYFSPWIFVFGGVFSLITVFISCRTPAKIAGRVSPVEALRYTEGKSRRKRKKKGKRGARLSRMALANLGRNKKKTAVVISSISLSMILLALVATLVGSFRMDQYLESRLVGDYMIGNVNFTRSSPISLEYSIDEAYMQGALEQPGITGAYELWVDYSSHNLTAEGMERYEQMYQQGKLTTEYEEDRIRQVLKGEAPLVETRYGYSQELLQNLKAVKGTIDEEKFQQGGYVLIQQWEETENCQEEDTLYEPGEKITLNFLTEDSQAVLEYNQEGEIIGQHYTNLEQREYEVMAVIQEIPFSMNKHSFSSNALTTVVPLSDIEDKMGSQMFAMSFQVEEEYRPGFEAFLKSYTQEVNSSMGYLSKDSLIKEFSGLINAVATVGYALCLVIAVIGILNFANSMLTGILSRRQELAVMQSIGMTKVQIKKMLLFESGYYILISAVISILLGSWAGYSIVGALNHIILCFQYRYTAQPFLIMIPVCAGMAVLISLAAYSQTQKKSVVERLRDSE